MSIISVFWNHIVRPWFFSEEKKLAWFGLLAIVILCLSSVYMGVILNDWSRGFYDAISNKDHAEFKKQLLRFIPLVIFTITSFCTKAYFVAWYSFRWREWETRHLRNAWLSHKAYYKLPHKDSIDNPDQRISSDVAQVTYGVIGIFQAFFQDGINFVTFSVILWNLSGDITVFGIKGFLLWAALLYALVGVMATLKIGRPIIDLDRAQEKCEANFRYGLMRINERREEIASLQGEGIERGRLQNLFGDLKHNYYVILVRQIYLNIFQNFYLNIQGFIPLFIASPAYFSGAITLGVLMQIRGIFNEVSGSLMYIVNSYYTIASLIASMQRLVSFKEQINAVRKSTIKIELGEYLKIKDCVLLNQDGQKMWDVPDMTIKKGDHMVLMAPSNTGKTSLLRLISGLANSYTGTLVKPESIMYIPQKAYMPVGTLRTVLSYPLPDQNDAMLIPLLKQTHLEHLIPNLDKMLDYQQTLSGGEQQRVNIIRVLLQKPEWLMMDEPFANLNADYVEELTTLIKDELKDSGVLIVSHSKLPHFKKVD